MDGKTLSGAAYTAGKGLFSELIIPTISKTSASIDELETELTKYTTADQQVSGEGTLDQEKIERKIEQKKSMKSAVEVSLEVIKATSRNNPVAKIVDAMLHAQSSLISMANSYETDIRELQKKLEKLQQFSSATSGLFSNSLSNLKLAMQSVTILNNTIVHPDGTYQLPPGVALSWFDQLKATDGTSTKNEDKQPDVGNREYKLIDLGYGKLWMWVEKGKNFATSEDIDVTLAYNEWVSRMIDKYGASFLIGEHQEDFLETFLRQNATLVKELSTGIDSVTGKPLTTQDRLLKMTTLANSMLTVGVAVKGVADVGKTSNSNSNTVKKNSGTNREYKYSHSVTEKAKLDPLYHDFPKSLDSDILSNPVMTRADGRIEHLAKGTVNGEKGIYQITVKGENIIHRTFIPESDWSRFSKVNELPQFVDIPSLK